MRLRWKEPERELRPLIADDESEGRDCCRLGRGMALGFGDCSVGVAAVSRMKYEAFDDRPFCWGSSLEAMEVADIRLDNAWLSLSRPVSLSR